MSDDLIGWLVMGGMAFLLIALMSAGLHYVVALKTPPTGRAAWTAGIAYLLTTLVFVLGGVDGYESQAPFFALPGALIVFLYWRHDFRSAWVEDPALMPPGASLANDDWRPGLVRFTGLLLTGLAAALIRMAFRGH